MSWFKKNKSNRVELYSLNWFIHVLINNVGCNKWIKMSKEEQIEYDKTHSHNRGYPYKVVTYPIPAGKDIILKDDVEGMSKIVAAIINDNPAMVVKVKNNPKLSSWFVGQIMKQTKDYDPKNLLDEINKQLEN